MLQVVSFSFARVDFAHAVEVSVKYNKFTSISMHNGTQCKALARVKVILQ